MKKTNLIQNFYLKKLFIKFPFLTFLFSTTIITDQFTISNIDKTLYFCYNNVDKIKTKKMTEPTEPIHPQITMNQIADRIHGRQRLDTNPRLESEYYLAQIDTSNNDDDLVPIYEDSLLLAEAQDAFDVIKKQCPFLSDEILNARLARIHIGPSARSSMMGEESDVYGVFETQYGVIRTREHPNPFFQKQARVHEVVHALSAPGLLSVRFGVVKNSGSGLNQKFTLDGKKIDRKGKVVLHELDEGITDATAVVVSAKDFIGEKVDLEGYNEFIVMFAMVAHIDEKTAIEMLNAKFGHGINNAEQARTFIEIGREAKARLREVGGNALSGTIRV